MNEPYNKLEGLGISALKRRKGSFWILNQGILEGNLPLALQLQLSQGSDAQDPGVVKALRGRQVELPQQKPLWSAFLLGLIVLAWIGIAFATNGLEYDQESLDVYRLLLGGSLIVTFSLKLVEGILLHTVIRGESSILRLKMMLMRIEPVAWPLASKAWKPLVIILAINCLVAVLGFSGAFPGPMGMGISLTAVLILAIRTCPTVQGPVSAMLGERVHVLDFPRALKIALTSIGNMETTMPLMFIGLRAVLIWSIAILALVASMILVFNPPGLSGEIWDYSWAALGIGLFLCFFIQASRAILEGVRVRKGGRKMILKPLPQHLKQWRESCALLYQLPILGSLKWVWYKVEAGSSLHESNTDESGFWWVAAGAVGLSRKSEYGVVDHQGVVRSGSAFGHVGIEGDRSKLELQVLEPSVLAHLASSQMHDFTYEFKKKLYHFMLLSLAFDRAPALSGILSKHKEVWLGKSHLEWVPTGTVLMEEGDEATWMGLVIQGSLRIDNHSKSVGMLGVVGPDSVIGDEILQEQTQRKFTLVTRETVMLARWESSWVRQYVSHIE